MPMYLGDGHDALLKAIISQSWSKESDFLPQSSGLFIENKASGGSTFSHNFSTPKNLQKELVSCQQSWI
jgi:hypothetical protein